MITCPNCHSQQPDDANFCDQCRESLKDLASGASSSAPPAQPTPTAVESNTCPDCGASVVPGEAFCGQCGFSLEAGASGQQATQASVQPEPSPGDESAGALVCPNCGIKLQPDSNFCDGCGKQLGAKEPEPVVEPGPTPDKEQYRKQYQEVAPPSPLAVQGRFVVQATNVTLPFPAGEDQFVIGREDPISGHFPAIDLTDHGADEKGVSRKHARVYIEGMDVFIEDLESLNLTFVNQERLEPHQRHPLNDGDEVRLGRLKLNVALSTRQ